MPRPDKNDIHCQACGITFGYHQPFRITRQLRKGQKSAPPHGTIWCFNCGAKWETEPLARERAA